LVADRGSIAAGSAVRRDCAPSAEELRAAVADAGPAVRRFLFGMCGDWDQAEDLAQEALLKAWDRRESFDGRSGARTWIFAIARNQWLDRLRRRAVRPATEPMNDATYIPAKASPPDGDLRRGEVVRAVRAALGELPADQREALALRESEGLSFAQIAEVLGVPLPTAKSRVRYALLKLAERLAPWRSELDS
jgi:RNA polymerase sigma-70 factor, ECF subfamily